MSGSLMERFVRERYPAFADLLAPRPLGLIEALERLGIDTRATPAPPRWHVRVRRAQRRGRYSGFLSKRAEDRREREIEQRLDRERELWREDEYRDW